MTIIRLARDHSVTRPLAAVDEVLSVAAIAGGVAGRKRREGR